MLSILSSDLLQTSAIWSSYAVAVAVCFIIATLTTVSWKHPHERSKLVTVVSIVTLTSLLATILLLPVDVALVSHTNSRALGIKKDWVTPERVHDILVTLKVAYYTLYTLDIILCLVVVPFAYFWYEEYDELEEEEGRVSVSKRAVAALKPTAICITLAVLVFIVGFFAPAADRLSGKHRHLDFYKKLLSISHGEKALTFILGILLTVGILLYSVYTSTGLALIPISLIRTAPSISAPELSATTAAQLEQNRERQRQLELRQHSQTLKAEEQRELDALVQEEHVLVRRERMAREAQGDGASWAYRAYLKLCVVFRPVKLVSGLLIMLMTLLIWTSMLITGIDKATHSLCKHKCGYILGHVRVFQPINYIFIQTAKAFPVDYILLAFLTLLFFSGTVLGLATIGIRVLWIQVFQLRRGKTAPQALLLGTVLSGLSILAIHYTITMFVAPQYATFGTQTFCTARPDFPRMPPNCEGHPDLVRPCSEAFKYKEAKDICTPTALSTLMNRITLTWPFLGIVDFWAQFVFLGVFLIVTVAAFVRPPTLNFREMDEDAEADEEESLLASAGRRFGATWDDLRGQAHAPRESPERTA